MSVHGCLQECRGLHGCKKFASSGVGRVYMMCEWISTRFSNNEFSEYFLETRVQISVAFNTYPIRILNISLSFFFRILVLKYDFFFAKWILFVFQMIIIPEQVFNNQKLSRKMTIPRKNSFSISKIVNNLSLLELC